MIIWIFLAIVIIAILILVRKKFGDEMAVLVLSMIITGAFMVWRFVQTIGNPDVMGFSDVTLTILASIVFVESILKAGEIILTIMMIGILLIVFILFWVLTNASFVGRSLKKLFGLDWG